MATQELAQKATASSGHATPSQIRDFLENFDPHSEFFVKNRDQVLEAVHATGCPVLQSALHGGFTVFGRYQTVIDVHQNEAAYSTRYKSHPPSEGLPALIPSTRSDPEHHIYRRILNPYFSAKAMHALAPRAREVVDELIDEGIARGKFDMVMDVGQPLVGIMTMELAGLPVENAREYMNPIHQATFRTGTTAEIAEGWGQLMGWIRRDIAELRRNPKGILGDLMVNADFEGRQLTDEEIELITLNIMIGGLGTSQGFMGSMTVHLARNPEQRQQLLDNPGLRRQALEEMLRFYSPQTMSARTVLHEVEVEGKVYQPGDRLLIAYSAGNLDPTKFKDPMKVDFNRWPNKHMTFGIGPHTCVGRHFAITMLGQCLNSLLEKVPNYKLVEEEVRQVDNIASITGYWNVPIVP